MTATRDRLTQLQHESEHLQRLCYVLEHAEHHDPGTYKDVVTRPQHVLTQIKNL